MKFGGFSFGSAGHACEFLIESKVVLNGDRGERLGLLLDRDIFLSLHRLVKTV